MSEPVYSRAPDVVWRLGPDRVLVRRVGPDRRMQDLLGEAAFVWVALDEPGTRSEVAARLPESGTSSEPETAIEQLIDCGLVMVNEHRR